MKTPPHKFRTGKSANGYKHGNGTRGMVTPEYRSWAGLRSRCLNPNSPKFRIYGGRGIKVCERWDEFKNFISDMGQKPTPDHTIERVDRNGNYEPSNCVWATPKAQARNRSTNHILTVNGVSKTMVLWSEQSGIKLKTLAQRIRKGWSDSDAVLKPLRGA